MKKRAIKAVRNQVRTGSRWPRHPREMGANECVLCEYTLRPCGKCARHAFEEAQGIWHKLAVAEGPEAVELKTRLNLIFAPMPFANAVAATPLSPQEASR